MVKKGTTNYKLNRAVEERGRKLVDRGFHNTMSDLIEYAVMRHILKLEALVGQKEGKV
jgi:hypothetical protein